MNWLGDLTPQQRVIYDASTGREQHLFFQFYMAGFRGGLQEGATVDSRNEKWLQKVEAVFEPV